MRNKIACLCTAEASEYNTRANEREKRETEIEIHTRHTHAHVLAARCVVVPFSSVSAFITIDHSDSIPSNYTRKNHSHEKLHTRKVTHATLHTHAHTLNQTSSGRFSTANFEGDSYLLIPPSHTKLYTQLHTKNYTHANLHTHGSADGVEGTLQHANNQH